MLIAVTEDGIYTQADQADTKRFYRCPVCLKPVVLKKGRYKIAHFSHQRIIDCHKSTYKTESPAHLKGKHMLYDLARPYKVDMEYYLSDIEQIPDILINRRLALELQLSVIPVDAIERRSAGYRKLGIKVIWIADEHALNKQTATLRLTAFQKALVQSARMQLYSFDSDLEKFYCYQLTDIQSDLSIGYVRTEIHAIRDFLQAGRMSSSAAVMTAGQKSAYIRQCLQKKDVREPTLSALYQLRIHHGGLPSAVGIVVPLQFFVRTHPVAWQCQLLLELKSGIFEMARFAEKLEFYGMTQTNNELTAELIKQYREAYKRLCVQ
ncbi:competence protein CoiA [Macrococcus carouselicus]|uniref:competence protein CoiA n=1 Tax=Macrococcus carouselicus TaxID=69969 RepID=UPI00140D1D9C|nr:competence protein CoiA family protein [Macrococcus carouselicus]